jgi:phospholipase C
MPSDPIKHVVVLMLENRSFDQMLGALQASIPELDGVQSPGERANKDLAGREYPQIEGTDDRIDPDPIHETPNVLGQLAGGNAGFVKDYETHAKASVKQRQQVMSYFPDGHLAALHELAKHFTVCDQWYSSVPGPTWTNRFFIHTGTSKGIVSMPATVSEKVNPGTWLFYDQDTIFDRLSDAGVPWRIYKGDIPQSLVMTHLRHPWNLWRFYRMSRFAEDAAGPEEEFPAYVFIEPRYFGSEQNDDHPPHSTMKAQALIADVYNALRSNHDLWMSTLLVITYDEHGGFYDHVSPPACSPPDDFQEEYTFDRLGVRVPALLVSPWMDARVEKTRFDHTSLLRYLIDKWGLRRLTRRSDEANSIEIGIRRTEPRFDTPESISVPLLVMAAGEAEEAAAKTQLNENQKALIEFAKFLETQTAPTPAKAGRVLAMTAASPKPAKEDAAIEAVDAFLEQHRLDGGLMSPPTP